MSAELAAIGLLNERFLIDYPLEAARALEGHSTEATIELMRCRSPAAQLRTWQVLAADRAADVLDALPPESARHLLAEADPQASVAALAYLAPSRRQALLSLLPAGASSELAALMQYPERTAGNMMDPRIGALGTEITVAEAVERLRNLRQRGLRELFVIDGSGHLVGQVELEDLVLTSRDRPIREITRGVTAFVRELDPAEQVVETLRKHPLSALPVVSEGGRFKGVIRQSELMAAVRLETSMDMQTMVGASADERALSSPGFAVRKRLPWLQLNLLTAFLAAAVVSLFESTIAQFTALAGLLPVVAGQSGNAGAQALAVTMRGLVLREVSLRQWPRVAFKEAAVGLINGLAVAAVAALGVYFWSGSAGLVLIIAIAMVISMIVAGLAGALVPVVLRRLGQDPATASSIILTTVTDVVGFFSFLGIATALGGMLQTG
jgi:magnesium transporter